MTKSTLFLLPMLVLFAFGTAHATPVIWSGTTNTDWGTGTNWTGGSVPNLNGTDTATVDNGDTVVYTPGGDLVIATGSSLTLMGGSTWQQNVGNWTRFNGGVMNLNGGTFERTAAGNLVVGFENGVGGTVTMSNASSLNLGGELWFGHNGTDRENQVSSVGLSGGSSITAAGSVGVWFWDTDTTGNSFNLDVTAGLLANTVNGRVGRRNTGGTNNSVTWETLWDEGILTVNGGNSGVFADHFTTTGTPGNTSYSLQSLSAVPEPASLVLLGLGGLAVLRLRRR